MIRLFKTASVVSLKFVEEVQTMAAAQVELKSPYFPLFKGDSIFRGLLTPYIRKGEGEIFGRNIAGVMQRTFGS